MGPVHQVRDLSDPRGLALGRRLGRHPDPHRVAEVTVGDLVDAGRQGGGEEHRLAVLGAGLEDRVEVVREAHVEHLVGLVEDHHRHRVEAQAAALDVVDGPARCGHHHVHAPAEHLELLHDGLAPEHRQDLHAEFAAVAVDGLTHLHGEFPGGHQDQRHGRGRLAGGDPLEDREREGRCLAGAGGGLCEQVAAGAHHRDRLGLDGGGLLVAQRLERGEDLRPEPEVGERGRHIGHAAPYAADGPGRQVGLRAPAAYEVRR